MGDKIWIEDKGICKEEIRKIIYKVFSRSTRSNMVLAHFYKRGKEKKRFKEGNNNNVTQN